MFVCVDTCGDSVVGDAGKADAVAGQKERETIHEGVGEVNEDQKSDRL